jgi:hypothetical protein
LLLLWAEGSRLASKSSFVIALARGPASEARCPAALELEPDPTIVFAAVDVDEVVGLGVF